MRRKYNTISAHTPAKLVFTGLLLLLLPVFAQANLFKKFTSNFEAGPEASWQSMPIGITQAELAVEQEQAFEMLASEFISVSGMASALQAAGIVVPQRVFCGRKAPLSAELDGFTVLLTYPERKLAGGQQWKTTLRVLLVRSKDQEHIASAIELQRLETWGVQYEVSRSANFKRFGQVVQADGEGPLEIITTTVRSRTRKTIGHPTDRETQLYRWNGEQYALEKSARHWSLLNQKRKDCKLAVKNITQSGDRLEFDLSITNKGESVLVLQKNGVAAGHWLQVQFETEAEGWVDLFNADQLEVISARTNTVTIEPGKTFTQHMSMPDPFKVYASPEPAPNAPPVVYHFNWKHQGLINIRLRLWGYDAAPALGLPVPAANVFNGRLTSNKIPWSR